MPLTWIQKIKDFFVSPTLRKDVDRFLKQHEKETPSEGLARKINTFVLGVSVYDRDAPDKDYWQTPKETISRKKGDCDDWAGLIFYLLKKLKFNNVRMGIFMHPELGGHMMVLWYESEDPWVLDSTGAASTVMRKLSYYPDWKLKASFDTEHEWNHQNW